MRDPLGLGSLSLRETQKSRKSPGSVSWRNVCSGSEADLTTIFRHVPNALEADVVPPRDLGLSHGEAASP